VSTTGMAPLERKAAFKAAVTMHQLTAAEAARSLKISYNHLMLVLSGDRIGSARLRQSIAAFLGRTDVEVFGSRAQRMAPEAPSRPE
jgi:transcriptional regulator with XRE-family HTH domain